MDSTHVAALALLLGDSARVITQPEQVEQLSRDFYWYSPVLRKQLDGKVGDVVVQPLSAAEIQSVLRYCHAQNLAVTARGAGTGNYGQAVPLRGGVVLDLASMDRIEAIQPEGVAVCQPGVRLGALENEARKAGWELRCYPSTIVKASLGGFLGGGSGGIGSVAHGFLRDFNTVRALEVVTMEAEPRVVLHEGEAVHEILHAWGTNGVITRIWLALAPAVEWSQCAVAFDTFDAALDFSEGIANGAEWTKRLVTTFEWPISSFFTPVKQYAPDGKALIFFLIASAQLAGLEDAARAAGGEVSYSGAYVGLRTRPLLSDRRIVPLRLIIEFEQMSVRVAELVGGPMPKLVSPPTDAQARSLQGGDAPRQSFRAAGAEGGVAEAGRLCAGELQRIGFVIVPAAQEDRGARAAAFGHAEHVDEEFEAGLRLGRQQFDMPEVGDVHDRLVRHRSSRAGRLADDFPMQAGRWQGAARARDTIGRARGEFAGGETCAAAPCGARGAPAARGSRRETVPLRSVRTARASQRTRRPFARALRLAPRL